MKPKDIKRIRERMAVPRRRFAAIIGVHVRTIRRWEEGDSAPQDRHLSLLRQLQQLHVKGAA